MFKAYRLASLKFVRQGKKSQRLSILVFILATILFAGSFLSLALTRGLNSMADRLGADIMVAPSGFDSNIKGALLRAESSDFFLPAATLAKVREIKGVKEATAQLFLMSLSASCCSYPVQIIGYEQTTDFNVKAWLKQFNVDKVKEDEIIVGHNIVAEVGSNLLFFNKNYRVIGKLEKTGMGFDNSVFVTMQEASNILKHDYFKQRDELKAEQGVKAPEGTKLIAKMHENTDIYSTILVRKEQDISTDTLARAINERFRGEQIYALTTTNLLGEVTNKISSLQMLLITLLVMLWILSFLVLYFAFLSIFSERQLEFATLLLIGAKQVYIRKLISFESVLVCLVGSILGALFSYSACMLFSTWIKEQLGLPFLLPSIGTRILLAILSIAICSLIGPISSYFVYLKFKQKAPTEVLRSSS